MYGWIRFAVYINVETLVSAPEVKYEIIKSSKLMAKQIKIAVIIDGRRIGKITLKIVWVSLDPKSFDAAIKFLSILRTNGMTVIMTYGMLNEICAAIKVTIPNFNPANRKITINETAVITSALINGMLAIPNHLRERRWGILHKPITAIIPITIEMVVDTTATKSEVIIDFRNGEL
jgi:hypothetical protein